MSHTDLFRRSLVFAAAAATIGTAVLVFGPTAMAEDAAKGRAMWEKAECSVCHGWAGDGVGADQSAPSLRVSHLSRARIREIIQCGLPGTSMPYFDRFAYADKRCYDRTAKELGKQMPDRSFVTLQAYEIDPLADYVATKIKGAGPVTQAECLE